MDERQICGELLHGSKGSRSTVSPSKTAALELVVPKSMPIIVNLK
jgi:hypothetical protein